MTYTNTLLRHLGILAASSLVVSCATSLLPQISSISPTGACDLMPQRSFTINGTGFLKKGDLPQVTFTQVANPSVTVTVAATSLDGCSDDNCTSLSVSVPKEQLPIGKYNVTVINACSGDCTSKEMGAVAQVDVVGAPQLASVTPQRICSGSGMLALAGSNI